MVGRRRGDSTEPLADRARMAAAIARRTMARGHVLGEALVFRDVATVYRTLFLGVAGRVGLLRELHGRAASAPQLAAALEVDDRDLLDALLALGAAVGELRVDRRGGWRLAGARARAVAGPNGDAVAAFVQEVLTHDAPGMDAVARRLRGEPVEFDYLHHEPALVARSSRIVEPILAEVVTRLVRDRGAATVLDVGCGSGVYLRHAVLAAPGVRAVGVDLDAEVVALARHNLGRWGVADRADVLTADLGALPEAAAGPYDVVLSLQNVYYAPPDEQPAFVAALRGATRPGGVVVIATVVRAHDAFAALFDVLLHASRGGHRVPEEADLAALLAAAGCGDIEVTTPMPGVPIRVAVGTA